MGEVLAVLFVVAMAFVVMGLLGEIERRELEEERRKMLDEESEP